MSQNEVQLKDEDLLELDKIPTTATTYAIIAQCIIFGFATVIAVIDNNWELFLLALGTTIPYFRYFRLFFIPRLPQTTEIEFRKTLTERWIDNDLNGAYNGKYHNFPNDLRINYLVLDEESTPDAPQILVEEDRDFREIIRDVIECRTNLVISGKVGSGKSVSILRIVEMMLTERDQGWYANNETDEPSPPSVSTHNETDKPSPPSVSTHTEILRLPIIINAATWAELDKPRQSEGRIGFFKRIYRWCWKLFKQILRFIIKVVRWLDVRNKTHSYAVSVRPKRVYQWLRNHIMETYSMTSLYANGLIENGNYVLIVDDLDKLKSERMRAELQANLEEFSHSFEYFRLPIIYCTTDPLTQVIDKNKHISPKDFAGMELHPIQTDLIDTRFKQYEVLCPLPSRVLSATPFLLNAIIVVQSQNGNLQIEMRNSNLGQYHRFDVVVQELVYQYIRTKVSTTQPLNSWDNIRRYFEWFLAVAVQNYDDVDNRSKELDSDLHYNLATNLYLLHPTHVQLDRLSHDKYLKAKYSSAQDQWKSQLRRSGIEIVLAGLATVLAFMVGRPLLISVLVFSFIILTHRILLLWQSRKARYSGVKVQWKSQLWRLRIEIALAVLATVLAFMVGTPFLIWILEWAGVSTVITGTPFWASVSVSCLIVTLILGTILIAEERSSWVFKAVTTRMFSRYGLDYGPLDYSNILDFSVNAGLMRQRGENYIFKNHYIQHVIEYKSFERLFVIPAGQDRSGRQDRMYGKQYEYEYVKVREGEQEVYYIYLSDHSLDSGTDPDAFRHIEDSIEFEFYVASRWNRIPDSFNGGKRMKARVTPTSPTEQIDSAFKTKYESYTWHDARIFSPAVVFLDAQPDAPTWLFKHKDMVYQYVTRKEGQTTVRMTHEHGNTTYTAAVPYPILKADYDAVVIDAGNVDIVTAQDNLHQVLSAETDQESVVFASLEEQHALVQLNDVIYTVVRDDEQYHTREHDGTTYYAIEPFIHVLSDATVIDRHEDVYEDIRKTFTGRYEDWSYNTLLRIEPIES